MKSELIINIVATDDKKLSSAKGERVFSCHKKLDSTMPDEMQKRGTTQCAPALRCIQELVDGNNVDAFSTGWCLSECNEGREITTMTKTTIEKISLKESQNTLERKNNAMKLQKMAPALHSQSSASLLLQTIDPSYFNLEVIGKNRTQHKSWRSGTCMENTNTLSMFGLYTAPAFIFTRRKMKSYITNILINIARQMNSFGGTAAQEFIGGITRGNIDAFTGWRIRNNEGKWTTQMTETTKITTNKMEETQNTGHQQQKARIQEIAPALLFSAITNNILFEGAKQ